MVLNVEKARPNNGILINRDRNCSGMTASNTSGYTPYQCSILTIIERWGLIYWKVGKSKIVSECELSKIL